MAAFGIPFCYFVPISIEPKGKLYILISLIIFDNNS